MTFPAEDLWAKRHRSYFVWEFGKPPEVVIEVVSNTEGGETTDNVGKYARLGVKYYVIFDPQQLLLAKMLQIYELSGGRYVLKRDQQLAQVGLGVVLWDGVFEGMYERWLRWCDPEGRLILSGIERAEQAEAKVNRERQYARQERQRAERLAARLRAMGIEPDDEG